VGGAILGERWAENSQKQKGKGLKTAKITASYSQRANARKLGGDGVRN